MKKPVLQKDQKAQLKSNSRRSSQKVSSSSQRVKASPSSRMQTKQSEAHKHIFTYEEEASSSSEGEGEGESWTASSLAPSSRLCGAHSKPLDGFCLTCGELVCIDCIFQTHKTHDFQPLGQARERVAGEIHRDLLGLEGEREEVAQRLKAARASQQGLDQQLEQRLSEARAGINELRRYLLLREKALEKKVVQDFEQHRQDKAAEVDRAEKELNKISSAISSARNHMVQADVPFLEDYQGLRQDIDGLLKQTKKDKSCRFVSTLPRHKFSLKEEIDEMKLKFISTSELNSGKEPSSSARPKSRVAHQTASAKPGPRILANKNVYSSVRTQGISRINVASTQNLAQGSKKYLPGKREESTGERFLVSRQFQNR